MSRRDHGPKRRAEHYAYRTVANAPYEPDEVRQVVVRAYMAGYGSASRARRGHGLKGPTGTRGTILTAEEHAALNAEFDKPTEDDST
jgi:hypothetical protein